MSENTPEFKDPPRHLKNLHATLDKAEARRTALDEQFIAKGKAPAEKRKEYWWWDKKITDLYRKIFRMENPALPPEDDDE